MPQSSKLHQSIQKAGAAVSASAASLATMAESHGKVVGEAMRSNPVAKENDGLLNHWKLVSLLAHELGAMDARLRELYHGIPAMVAAAKSSLQDVVSKESAETKPKRGRKPGTKIKPDPKSKVAKATKADAKTAVLHGVNEPALSKKKATGKGSKPRSPKAFRPLKGNDAKVLTYLDTVLGKDSFTAVRHNEVATGAAIPVGSVARALDQLVKRGLIKQGEKGEFKRLADEPANATETVSV